MSRTAKPKRKSRRVRPASGRAPISKLREADWQALSDELIRYHRRVRDVFPSIQERPDPAIYLSNASYPSTRAELVSVQRWAGFDVALVKAQRRIVHWTGRG